MPTAHGLASLDGDEEIPLAPHHLYIVCFVVDSHLSVPDFERETGIANNLLEQTPHQRLEKGTLKRPPTPLEPREHDLR